MSVLVKGMEKPPNCFLCKLSFMSGERLFCSAMKNEEVLRSKIDSNCPLVHVPPHGRLIEEEPIIKYITDGLNSGKFGYDAIEVMAEVKYAPTIIEAEGRE